MGAATGARLINDLEAGGGKHLIVENLSLGGRSGARHPWEVDEQIVAHLQVPTRAGGSRGGRLVINHLLLGSGLAGLPGRPLGGVLSSALGGLLGGDLLVLCLSGLGDILDDGVYVLPVR